MQLLRYLKAASCSAASQTAFPVALREMHPNSLFVISSHSSPTPLLYEHVQGGILFILQATAPAAMLTAFIAYHI